MIRKEDAIKVILNFPVENTEEKEAVMTAVEALKQEPRKKTINIVSYFFRWKNDIEDFNFV